MRRSVTWGSLALALAVAALLPAGAGARACSPNKGNLFPRLTSPCNHAVIASGKRITFKVRDVNKNAHKYPPFLNLTKKPPRHGILKDDRGGFGLFTSLKAVRGHPSLFTVRPAMYNFPGYWAVTPGKYYVQVQQVDCSVHGCTRYSPVTTITVH